MLSHGMKQVGSISFHNFGSLVLAVTNPWVAVGIILLLAFFASYMNALSWADLTYVLPATSLGYVLLALVARFALHEQVSPLRWMGIALISGGVGFVAGGPSVTHNDLESSAVTKSAKEDAHTTNQDRPAALPNSARNGMPDDASSRRHMRAVGGGEP